MTKSGFIIPEAAKGRPTKGEVLFVGDDPAVICIPGDHVVFPEHAGYDFNYCDVDLKVIRWADIHAIMPRDVLTLEEHIRRLVAVDNQVHLSVVDEEFAGTIASRLRVVVRPIDRDGFTMDFWLQGNVLIPIPAVVEKKQFKIVQEVLVEEIKTDGQV